ncbi:MAG: DUF3995 domain-containing protein [Candidatus Dormibacteria bacterium]
MRKTARAASLSASIVLAWLSALHLSWAAGSTWPATDESRLADCVVGLPQMPSRRACLVVGAGLGLAAAAVSGGGGTHRLARVARATIASAFIVRGAAGVTGNTNRLVSWKPSSHFAALDRRYYGPLCVLIGAAAATSITGPSR